MRSFLIAGVFLLGCTPKFVQGHFDSAAGAGGEGSEGGAEMIGVSGRHAGRGGMIFGASGTGSETSSDAGEGSTVVPSAGGSSSGTSAQAGAGAGGEGSQGGAGSPNGGAPDMEAGASAVGGSSGSGGKTPTCADTGITIKVAINGGLTVSSLCVTTGDPEELRMSVACTDVSSLPVVGDAWCFSETLPVAGTRYCFDALIQQGGRACDRVGQEYCGSPSQYVATVGGEVMALTELFFPMDPDCHATASCKQAVCFTVGS